MWQDALALLIVAVAVLALLRLYLPGLFRFGGRRASDALAQKAPSAGGCSGCALGSSCAKTLIQARSGVIQPGE